MYLAQVPVGEVIFVVFVYTGQVHADVTFEAAEVMLLKT